MRSEDETRMSQLPKLIAEEEDPDQVKILAFELERLLSGSLLSVSQNRLLRPRDKKSLTTR
jgi:hypothetical protein